MKLVIALILAWVATPLLLELINRKGFKINGVPAWIITAVACLAVALVVNAVTSAVHWAPFDIFALTAIIFFGSNAFFTFVVKLWMRARPFVHRG